jgi:hypothetical protein
MKKDPNHIAALEKAVAEKYGKDAVQDFRSLWTSEKEKNYISDVKAVTSKTKRPRSTGEKKVSDDTVIKTRRKHHTENRTCPVCKTYSFSGRDDLYMNRYECCYLCYTDFVLYREEAWKNGNRPSEEEFQYAMRRRK